MSNVDDGGPLNPGKTFADMEFERKLGKLEEKVNGPIARDTIEIRSTALYSALDWAKYSAEQNGDGMVEPVEIVHAAEQFEDFLCGKRTSHE